MKKMKRFLVAMLGGLTAIACLAGISACKKEKEATVEEKPSYDININVPGVEVETCVHDYSVVYAEEKATCDNQGMKLMGCSKCGDAITVYTGFGHDYGTATCTEEATCWICGEAKDMRLAAHTMVAAACEKDAYCSECGYVEEGTALEHVVVEATCTADSYCSVCNANFGGKHNVVDAFGTLVEDGEHSDAANLTLNEETGIYYVAPVHTATEWTEGYEAFKYCADCLEAATADDNLAWAIFTQETRTAAEKAAYLFGSGLVYTEGYKTIASEHNYVDYFDAEDVLESGNFVDPTCTTNGLKNFKYCADCATVSGLTTEAALAEAVVVADGAERPAIYAVDYAAAVVAKLGHTSIDAEGNNSFVAGTPATCTQPGTQWKADCARCGAQMNEFVDDPVEALGHDYNGKEPTCFKAVNCINCGEEWSREHVMSGVKVELAKAPTCTEAGYENVTVCTYEDCTYCEFDSIPMLNHDWSAYSEAADKESVTCAEGLVAKNVYKCDTCEQFAKLASGKYTIVTSIYEVKPLTTHTKSEAFADATCIKPAQNVDCAVCGKEGVFAKDALGHKYANAATTTTCFQDGKCTRENCDYDDGVIPAFDHETEDGSAKVPVEAKAPTCTTTGYVAHEKCTLCNNLFYNGTMEVTVGYDAEGNPVTVKHSTKEGGTLFLAKVSHVYEEVAEKLPTCQEAGYSAHEVCVNCGNKAGYTTNGYAKKACASDTASCYDFVACNHSYVVIEGTDIVVAKEGKYVYENEAYRLATAEEIEAGDEYIYETEWKGCGELTKTTNKIACVTHNQDGFCTVCNKPVAHNFVEVEGSDDLVCACGKVKED